MSVKSYNGPAVYKKKRMVEAELLETKHSLLAVYSSRSPNKDTVNEDAAAIVPVDDDYVVLIVADGVGGLPGGEHASATAIETLKTEIAHAKKHNREIREAILEGMEKTNASLLRDGIGSATTLAVAEVNDHTIRSYHAGDSLALSCGQRGRRKLETIPHSPVGYAFESGALTENDAFHHEERHLVSNIVGTPNMHISICANTRMEKKDTLLIATDGLFDNIQKQEIIDIIRKGPLEECAQSLVQLARERMQSNQHPYKADDMTFILFRQHD